MKTPQQKLVSIQENNAEKPLSKAQKQFNSLLKKIDTEKKLLQQWKDTIPQYHFKLNGEYEDLWDEYNQQRVKIVYVFDSVYEQKLFTKTDKNKLKHLINTIVTELVFEHGVEDVKELYNKYSGGDYHADVKEAEEEADDMMKSLLKEMFGHDIEEDIDMRSPEKIREFIQDKFKAHQEQQQLNEEKPSSRKKTAKQLAKEAKLEEEAQQVSKSIQAVYRKLASSIHPDREQDEAERERKTKIMQEVNVAYKKKDLLRLLELQLQLEHIDQTDLNNIAEERLKYFNKILKEQLNELQIEIDSIEHGLKMQANFSPFSTISPTGLMAKLAYDIQDVTQDIVRIKNDLEKFEAPQNIKAFLKNYKIPKPRAEPNFGDLFFH